MNSSRLEQLIRFLEESPDDPFILYALALEYKSTQPEQSARLFSQLIEHHPDYLPTYYQAALQKEEAGEKVEALNLYKAGMEVAKKQNDLTTLNELKAAYDLLLDD